MCGDLNMENMDNHNTLTIAKRIMAFFVRNQLASALIIGGVVALVLVVFFPDKDFDRPRTTWEKMPATPGQRVTIRHILASRNEDGIIFILVKGTVHEYEGELAVAVRTKDAPEWSEHDKVEWRYHRHDNGDVRQIGKSGEFVVDIQFGSNERPIRGGEEYLLRISAGEDSATASVTMGRE